MPARTNRTIVTHSLSSTLPWPSRTHVILLLFLFFNFSAHAERALTPATIPIANAPLEALQCAGCHGPRGMSQGPGIPIIAGMRADEMQDAFSQFRAGRRAGTVMPRLAQHLEDAQVARIAEYFASQPFGFHSQRVDAVRAARGQEIHQKYCNRCHGQDGTSNRLDAPILAGQWMTYLRFSLADFQAEHRPAPQKMRSALHNAVSRYGTQALEDVVHFYGSRQP